jgi:hypothetical protein
MYENSHVLKSSDGESVDLREFWRSQDHREAALVESVPQMEATEAAKDNDWKIASP